MRLPLESVYSILFLFIRRDKKPVKKKPTKKKGELADKPVKVNNVYLLFSGHLFVRLFHPYLFIHFAVYEKDYSLVLSSFVFYN